MGRVYDKTQWLRLRRRILAAEPFCVHCKTVGIIRLAEEVDHIKRVSEAPELQFDPDNLQPLCKPCHSRKTRREQLADKGAPMNHDENGYPIDNDRGGYWYNGDKES